MKIKQTSIPHETMLQNQIVFHQILQEMILKLNHELVQSLVKTFQRRVTQGNPRKGILKTQNQQL